MSSSLASSSLRKVKSLLGEAKQYHSLLNIIKPQVGPLRSVQSVDAGFRNTDKPGDKIKLPLGLTANFASSQNFDGNNPVCWKCGLHRKDASKIFCEECHVVQNPNDSNNYFKVFHLDEKFDIDHKALKDMYRKLQSVLHPDRFSNKSEEEKEISTNYSSLVNKAYNSLQMPLKRAEHLLELKGDSIKENQSVDNPEFLMEMMELNEEMESVTTAEQLKELNLKNKNELEKIVREIDQCFQENDLEKAKECIVRMKYYSSLGLRINNMLRERVPHSSRAKRTAEKDEESDAR